MASSVDDMDYAQLVAANASTEYFLQKLLGDADPAVVDVATSVSRRLEAIRSRLAIACGQRIGRALARDVIADGMSRDWIGLESQEVDLIPDGVDHAEVERVAKSEYYDAINRLN